VGGITVTDFMHIELVFADWDVDAFRRGFANSIKLVLIDRQTLSFP
jgi:hypothetical protein